MLVVPRIHTELARRTFSVAAPSTCNSLPADIRLCESILAFKHHLKTICSNSLSPPVLLKHLCIFRPKGAIQIRYYYYFFLIYLFFKIIITVILSRRWLTPIKLAHYTHWPDG